MFSFTVMVVDICARFLTRFGIRNLFMTPAIYCDVPIGIAKDPSSIYFPPSFSVLYLICSMRFDCIGGVEKV